MSSDEQAHTSNEDALNVTDQFIADCAADTQRRWSKERTPEVTRPEAMIKEAETSKARMVVTLGNELTFIEKGLNWQSTAVDENYMVIGAHLDNSVKQKIVNHEYVDFSRLLPHDRVTRDEAFE